MLLLVVVMEEEEEEEEKEDAKTRQWRYCPPWRRYHLLHC